MDESDIFASGNRFLFGFLLVFLFIQFAIIEPHFSRDKTLEQKIEATLQQLNVTEGLLRTRLARLDSRAQIGIPPQIAQGTHQAQRTGKSYQSDWEKRFQKSEETESLLREKLVQLGVESEALLKVKLEKKQYSIPIISVSIEEDTLLRFFPLLVVVCITRLLVYRSAWLKKASFDQNKPVPLWAGPVPYLRMQNAFRKWIGLNFLNLLLFGTIILFTLRFVFVYAAEERMHHLRMASIGVLALLVWVVTYLVILVRAVANNQRPNDGSPVWEAE